MRDIEPSTTFKLRAPGVSEHAIYFTIVGETEPKAFFVNSKEMASFQWITALMTSYSKHLKQGVDVKELIRDMKCTFDPKGSYIIPDGSNTQVPSIVAHFGILLEKWLKQEKGNGNKIR